MPADDPRARFPRDDAVGPDVLPAFVHLRRGVEDSDFADRGVHRDKVLVVDAKVRPERTTQRILEPAGVQLGVLFLELAVVDPVLAGADAVLVPAFHRAAGARPAVVLARPLVVTTRHVVEHARADFLIVAHDRARPKQVVHDGRQTEAGAGALGALIENGHLHLAIVVERPLGLHLDERRLEHAIAEVQRVGPRIEHAVLRRVATGSL